MDHLERLAEGRRRVLTTAELLSAGYADHDVRRLRRQGRLVPLARGVLAVPPVLEPVERATARGLVRLHPRAAVSCEAALVLHGCPVPHPAEIHLVDPGALHTIRTADLRVHRTRHPAAAVVVDGIPAVEPAEALVGAWTDLASADDRRAIVCAALSSGVTTTAAVARREPAARRVTRAQQLLTTCGLVDRGCESPPEIDYLLLVETAHRLPAGRRQVWIRLPDGRRRRVDVCYGRVIVEVDGAQHWLDAAARAADQVGDRALAALGYVVLRFTWAEIRQRPAYVAAQVRRALELAA